MHQIQNQYYYKKKYTTKCFTISQQSDLEIECTKAIRVFLLSHENIQCLHLVTTVNVNIIYLS